MSAELKPLACPFCGHVGLDFTEGSTFRHIVASCGGCGATRDETRIQTLGQGTKDEWMAEARNDAIEHWNKRTPSAPGAPQEAAARRLAFLCNPAAGRYIEQEGGLWRVYHDIAPAEAERHDWRAMTYKFYPTADEAIDAALAGGDGGEGS